jgi:hypothetical protein
VGRGSSGGEVQGPTAVHGELWGGREVEATDVGAEEEETQVGVACGVHVQEERKRPGLTGGWIR